MLYLYRRHQPPCKSRNPYHKKSACPMRARGIVEGVVVRHSLKTRSWEHAEQHQGKSRQPEVSFRLAAAGWEEQQIHPLPVSAFRVHDASALAGRVCHRAAVTALVPAVAITATTFPAWRASRIDPIVSLRVD